MMRTMDTPQRGRRLRKELAAAGLPGLASFKMTVKTYFVTLNQCENTSSSCKGFLIISTEQNWVWLKDQSKKTIRKGKVGRDFFKQLECGSTIRVSDFSIKIVKELCKRGEDIVSDYSTEGIREDASTLGAGIVACTSTSNDIKPTTKPTNEVACLDAVLMRSMRPYQIQAAEFILRRLQDLEKVVHTDIPLTGAILADDMGTGKTLVGLSVLWALCRHGRAKGIIVCPSALVANWRKEVTKWLPGTLGRTALYATGGKSSSSLNDPRKIVRLFASSACSVHPLLVTSYELFRVFADDFNAIDSLSTILCDEGHRLKNADGTKTTLALGRCIAMQRLVLTGTPVQNNLDELYAVVNFAVPGYLGTLKQFQVSYGNAISAGAALDCTQAELDQAEECHRALQEKLSPVLIRRTGVELLKNVLPPRAVITLGCVLTDAQRIEYERIAAEGLLRGDDTEGGMPAGEEGWLRVPAYEPAVKRRRRCGGMSAATGDADPAGREAARGDVLHVLQQLRMVCSVGSVANSGELNETKSVGTTPLRDRLYFDAKSTKYKVLGNLFRRLHPCRESGDANKVVVVSNYISTLDDVEDLVNVCGLSALRIDGSVGAEKRQNPQHMYLVMLISTRAGGVGLNLTGANRLVLLDPDWNPATDQQAIGRIWRLGQTRDVFIYRLVSVGTLEESIVGRQIQKLSLTSVIERQPADRRLDRACPVEDSTIAPTSCVHRSSSMIQACESVPLLPTIKTRDGLRKLILPGNHMNDKDVRSTRQKEINLLRDDIITAVLEEVGVPDSVWVLHKDEI